MTDETTAAHQTLGVLFAPLARLMVSQGVPLGDGVELLKSALIEAAQARAPGASASQHSLMTGVHRKDIKRLSQAGPQMQTLSAAARVLGLWQSDPDLPEGLSRAEFDALVKRAKVDAAPATVLTLLEEAGNVVLADGHIRFVSAALVPAGMADRLAAASATLGPHLETTIGNLDGARPQWDQALRYSHLSAAAARELEVEAARLAREMLETLNARARDLQGGAEGDTLFVAGTFTHVTGRDD